MFIILSSASDNVVEDDSDETRENATCQLWQVDFDLGGCLIYEDVWVSNIPTVILSLTDSHFMFSAALKICLRLTCPIIKPFSTMGNLLIGDFKNSRAASTMLVWGESDWTSTVM